MNDRAASSARTADDKSVGVYAYYVLALLTLTYVFNFIDRQILGIVSQDLKEDLDLTDSQLGLLKGFAFALLYTLAGIPIARWADRSSRIRIVSLAVTVWSFFTVLSGFAQNYTQLLLARIGVGIGEAGGSPPSHSMISDYFPKEQRASALGVYSLGIPIGIMFAYLAGGWINSELGWRAALIAVGAPGIALGLLMYLTVDEPERGAADAGLPVRKHIPSIGERLLRVTSIFRAVATFFTVTAPAFLMRLLRHATPDEVAHAKSRSEGDGSMSILAAARHLFSIPTYAYACAGITAASFFGYAFAAWTIGFYVRVHIGTVAEVGPEAYKAGLQNLYLALGLIAGIAYGLGTYLGGALTERLAKNDKSYYVKVPAVAMLLTFPLAGWAVLTESYTMSLVLTAVAQVLLGLYLAPTFALAQTLAPLRIRALSTAILFFVLNLIALGIGPSFTGVLSDILGGGSPEALRWALFWTAAATLISAVFYWRAAAFINEDWRNATGEG